MPENKESSDDLAPDPWSIQFARVAGISLRLHVTLLLLLVYVGVTRKGMLAFVAGLFFCILLHELGHALTARRFGYPIRRITLYPIGGIATLEENPKPRHELWIALAGPAVNVAIVAALAVAFRLTGVGLVERLVSIRMLPGGFLSGGDTLTLLAVANVSLVVFNLIPAFPMDGGRVLRAALAIRLGELRATAIAARIGQGLAIVGGLWGLLSGHFTLVLIALFVYFGAGQEMQGEATRSALEGTRVGDAMVTEVDLLTPGATLGEAAQALLASSQQDFPVALGDEVLGLLSRDRLLQGLAQEGRDAFVGGVMDRALIRVTPEEPLEPYLMRPDGLRRAPLLVFAPSGKLLGMVTQENVMEYLLVRRIDDARAAALPGRG